jgi:transcription elongation factor GreA
MDTDQYLTEDRLGELKVKLSKLKTEKRAEVAKRLKRAKELGDLSENSEYQEAREEQQRVERRIAELENLIRGAIIIQKKSSDVISIGSTIQAERNGEKLTLTIVGPNEARPEEGRISNVSPIGKAFLDKKVGENVTVKTPRGETIYKIISID